MPEFPNYAPDFRNYAHCRDHESARVKVMAELAVTYAFTELKKTFVEEQMCATYSRVRYYFDKFTPKSVNSVDNELDQNITYACQNGAHITFC